MNKFHMKTSCKENAPSGKPVADVYFAALASGIDLEGIYPTERREEIQRIANEDVRRQKYSVWKLLEYGLEHTFGMKIKESEICKSGGGKWVSPSCAFSLTHCKSAVAVVISRNASGIDIESVHAPRKGLERKILNDKETELFRSLPEAEQSAFLLKKWTEKESLFKQSGGTVFVPREIDTLACSVQSFRIRVSGEEHLVTVASDDLSRVRLFPEIEL